VGWGGMHHCPMWRSRIKTDVLTAVILACWAPAGHNLPPKSRKSQHNTTAPGSRITQHRITQHRAQSHRWLFTAWVQLLVCKDTVALFQYQHKLWGILKLATKTDSFSPVFIGLTKAAERAPSSLLTPAPAWGAA
jgi:hypothetical protein